MQFTQEMMLHSDSGYCMPFEERDKDVEMTLGYGKQRHPKTNETFFHHGTDFKARTICFQPYLRERSLAWETIPFMVSTRLSDMEITR